MSASQKTERQKGVDFGRPRRAVTCQCALFDAPPVWFWLHLSGHPWISASQIKVDALRYFGADTASGSARFTHSALGKRRRRDRRPLSWLCDRASADSEGIERASPARRGRRLAVPTL